MVYLPELVNTTSERARCIYRTTNKMQWQQQELPEMALAMKGSFHCRGPSFPWIHLFRERDRDRERLLICILPKYECSSHPHQGTSLCNKTLQKRTTHQNAPNSNSTSEKERQKDSKSQKIKDVAMKLWRLEMSKATHTKSHQHECLMWPEQGKQTHKELQEEHTDWFNTKGSALKKHTSNIIQTKQVIYRNI